MRTGRITISILLILALLCGIASAEDVTSMIISGRTTQSFTDEPVADEDLRTILEAGLAASSAINQQPWYFVAITNKEVMNEINGSAGGFGGGFSGSFGGNPPTGGFGGSAPADGSGGNNPFGGFDGSAPSGGFGGNAPFGGFDGNNPSGGFGGNTPFGGFDGNDPADSSGGNNPTGNEFAPLSQGGSVPGGSMPGGSIPGGNAFGGSAKAALGDSPVAIIVYMDESTSSPNPSFDCGLACENMVIAAKSLGYGAKIISSPTMQLNGSDHDALCEKLGVDKSYTAVAVLLIGREAEAVDGASGASERSALEDKVSFVD